ncbi:tRNA lysidine(34) synthetase TilS [Bacillus lacus]|uniref:tRNA(Ile)-lysidine synthase n=1 Tax=Metabacillus lacus TaxID=1983721 RepID=A0A7X2J0A1_9BACI|nr:tRNA lysidine(34) synthetase TilS [Metabacillus lacus]MRX72971.1 tRNA lysidine(34) synthetase TilS [Metabacillus lacus]
MDSFYEFINRNSLILPFSTITVGVSGGPDSLALLHLLAEMRTRKNLKLAAVHLDHMFRGEESEREMNFVISFCKKLQIPCEAKQVDVKAYQEARGLSSQVAARECRYAFYKEAMEKHGAGFLALGHHADDQVETILMRLARGSTGEGTAGIPVSRSFHNGVLIRPLLGTPKSDILSYCEEHGLQPRFDPSNDSDTYTRNRFRQIVLPFLKQENPRVHERFQHFSENLREDEAYLEALTEKELHKVFKRKGKHEAELDSTGFNNMASPLQRRAIQLILNYLYKQVPPSISSIHIEKLRALISQKHPSGSLDYPKGLKVIKSYQKCLFTFEQEKHTPFMKELSVPGIMDLENGYQIIAELKSNYLERSNFSITMNPESISLPLVIRSRKQGDKMKLMGMNGSKKVKDIFINEKIPIHKRESWPIVEDAEGNIVWIPGLKKSAFAVSDPKGENIVLHYQMQ